MLETETILQLDGEYITTVAAAYSSSLQAEHEIKGCLESGSSTSECSVGNLQSLKLIDRDIYGQDLQVCRAREQLDH